MYYKTHIQFISFKKVVLFAIIILKISGSLAQENLSQLADKHLKRSDSLFKARNFKIAVKEAQIALPIYKKILSEVGIVKCYNIIGYSLVLSENYNEGKVVLDKSLDLIKNWDNKYSLEEAFIYEALGRYCNAISDFDCALKNYQKSVWIAKKNKPLNHLEIAEIHISLAVNNFMTSTFLLGEKHLDTVLTNLSKVKGDISEPMARYYANSAYMKHGAGYFKKAIDFYEKQITTYNNQENPNNLGIANAYANMGIAYKDLWNFNKGLECIEKSLSIFIEELGENNYNVSHNYMSLAELYANRGEGQKALEYNKRAITINEKLFSSSHYNVAASYESLATTYGKLNDFENEFIINLKCLEIYKSLFGERHKKIAILYQNIGRIKRKQGEIQSSIEYSKKAIEIANLVFERDNIILANMYQNLAETYALNNSKIAAESLFDKAIQIKFNTYGAEHVEVAESINAKAQYLFTIGKYETAVNAYNRVLKIYEKDVLQILDDFYVDHEFHLLKVLLQTIEGKANSMNGLYQKTGNYQLLEKSIDLFEKAQVISHKMRQVVFDYKDRIWVSEFSQSVPKGGIEAIYLYFENNKDPKLIEKSFEFLERSRSNTLRESIDLSSSKNTRTSLGKIAKQESELKAIRSSYISRITEIESMKEVDSTKLAIYKDDLFQTKLKYDSLIQFIRKENPAYFNIEYNSDGFNLSELQNFLEDKASFLEFFQIDSTVFTLLITKNNILLKKKVVPNLRQRISGLKRAILDRDIKKYIVNAHSLYSELIEPIGPYLVGDRLIISPHNDLWNINFELLLTEIHNTTSAKELPYLLKKYAVSYSNSARTLINKNPEENNELIQECLAFSFTNTDAATDGKSMDLAVFRNTDEDLPGSRKEIKAISKIVDGQYYFGQQANEAAFKSNVSKYKILHLALHGEVDGSHPENSKLYFSNKKDSIEDNILYSHELFSMNIPAELAVLSACSTGTGKVSTSEGIMSLGSAFQYAGTKSLLLTSWEVSDEITPYIMEKFYNNLKKGMDKSKAIQQAKLEYLKESDVFRSDPFYWGSFYLIGDTKPLKIQQSYFWLYVLLSFFSITLISYFTIKRLRR